MNTPQPENPAACYISQNIEHGYFVFLSGSGPLRALPIAWFAYDQDAKDWAAEHGSADYPCEIKPCKKREPDTSPAGIVAALKEKTDSLGISLEEGLRRIVADSPTAAPSASAPGPGNLGGGVREALEREVPICLEKFFAGKWALFYTKDRIIDVALAAQRTQGAIPDGKQLVSEVAIAWLHDTHPEIYLGFYERLDSSPTKIQAKADSDERDQHEKDEDAFNDWNRDVTGYVPTLWDAYCFGLSWARSALSAQPQVQQTEGDKS